MATRSNVSSMSREALEQIAAQQLRRIPVLQISLWANAKRTDENNWAHFTGQIAGQRVLILEQLRDDLTSPEAKAALDKVIADITGSGKVTFAIYADVWHNPPGVGKSGGPKPLLSGPCRNFVGAKAESAATAQSDSLVAALKEAAAL